MSMRNQWIVGNGYKKIAKQWWPVQSYDLGVITPRDIRLSNNEVYGAVFASCRDNSGFNIGDIIKSEINVFASAIAVFFPQNLKKYIPELIGIIVSMWTAGALTALIESAIPSVSTEIANQIAQQIVGSVLTPTLFNNVRVPSINNVNKFNLFVSEIMKPMNLMAKNGNTGGPMDGVGKALAEAVYDLLVPSNVNVKIKQEKLKYILNQIAVLQSNFAVLITVAFTNSLHADYALMDCEMPSKTRVGWSPDYWFRWVQSLPHKMVSTQSEFMPILPIGPSPYGWRGVDQNTYKMVTVLNQDGKLLLKDWERRGVSPAELKKTRSAQESSTAKRNALRAYFIGSGIPAKAADWLQSMIDSSPAAQKIATSGSIVDIVLKATGDAVHAAVVKHAKPLPAVVPRPAHSIKTETKTGGKPKSLAPLLSSAIITAKLISAGIL